MGKADGAAETRLALIADVHGNLPALDAVLADIRACEVESVYCLGDLVGYGPDPNGVILRIRAEGITSLLGNYDDGVGWERGECGCYYGSTLARSVGDASYAYTAREVTEEHKTYLRGLPREIRLVLGGARLHLVHGSPRKINEYLLRGRDERTFLRIAAAEIDDVLAFGHTHDAWDRCYGRVHFVSVGSVGRPKDGDPRAAYSLLHLKKAGLTASTNESHASRLEVQARRVAYDVSGVASATERAGLPVALADSLRTGRGI